MLCFCCKKQDKSVSPTDTGQNTNRNGAQTDEQFGFTEAYTRDSLRENDRFNQQVMSSNEVKGAEEVNYAPAARNTNDNTFLLSVASTPRSIGSVQNISNTLVIPYSVTQQLVVQDKPRHTMVNIEKVEIHNPHADAIIIGNESSVNIRKDEDVKKAEKLQVYDRDNMIIFLRKERDAIDKKLQEMEKGIKQEKEIREKDETQNPGFRRWSARTETTGMMYTPYRSEGRKSCPPMDFSNTSSYHRDLLNTYSFPCSEYESDKTARKSKIPHSQEATVTEEHPDIPCDESGQAKPTTDRQLTHVASLHADSQITEHRAEKHFTHSRRGSKHRMSFKKASRRHKLLQNMHWDQYEIIQDMVVRRATIELHKCQSVSEVKETVSSIKEQLIEIIERKTDELIKAYSKSPVARKRSDEHNGDRKENASFMLNEYRNEVIQDANDQMEHLSEKQLKQMKASKQQQTFRNENVSDEGGASEAAECFIRIITNKTEEHVLTLLPLAVQRKIVLLTFKCQKSYVIKNIMKEIAYSGYFTESMKYILDPNGYAENWLFNCTNKIIFNKRKAGMHFYAEVAKREIESIIEAIKKSISMSKVKSDNESICNWTDEFVRHIQMSEVLPIQVADLENVKRYGDVDMKRFLLFVNKRLDFMRDGVLQKLKGTTEKKVNWTDNPHKRIFKKLWGCTYCCPFCHEPCYFTDKAHVKNGLPHKCIQHRPLGVFGFMSISDSKLITEWCGQLIQNTDLGYKFTNAETLRPCTEYKDEFPDWIIDECNTQSEMNPPMFWIWFICKYILSLQEVYGANAPELSNEWKRITEKDAVTSLDYIYICR